MPDLPHVRYSAILAPIAAAVDALVIDGVTVVDIWEAVSAPNNPADAAQMMKKTTSGRAKTRWAGLGLADGRGIMIPVMTPIIVAMIVANVTNQKWPIKAACR